METQIERHTNSIEQLAQKSYLSTRFWEMRATANTGPEATPATASTTDDEGGEMEDTTEG